MRILLGIVVALGTSVATAFAQQTPPDLKIAVVIDHPIDPAHTEIVIRFLNQSEHTLSFPRPGFICHAYPGAVTGISKFTPIVANSIQASTHMGCSDPSRAFGHTVPPILEQAKTWILLHSGESADVRGDLRQTMVIGEPGTYELHFIYEAVSLSAEELTILRTAGYLVPSGQV